MNLKIFHKNDLISQILNYPRIYILYILQKLTHGAFKSFQIILNNQKICRVQIMNNICSFETIEKCGI